MKKKSHFLLQSLLTVWALWLSSSLLAEPVIDDSPTRVQTTLKVDMRPIGTLRPKSVAEISTRRWTIGCEVLDRDYACYDSYKEYLAPLGIKRIRLQGGWAKTEKEKGLYDFAWMDHIVQDAMSRGLEIWFETSYGNPIYAGGGGRSLAGGIPVSEEGLAAWDNWVSAAARRYKDKIKEWCVWNEPIFSKDPPEKIFAFNIRTAELIKKEIPDAKISALVLMQGDYAQVGPFLETLKKEGKLDLFDAIVYHHYTDNPDEPYDSVEAMKKVIRSYSPNIRLWQGESGTMSEWGKCGALNQEYWSELTQAKWDARRMLGDIGHDADSGIFTIADYEYRTTPWLNGPAHYGLLKVAGASQGFKMQKVKIAYYAVQNVVSVFNDALQRIPDFAPETASEKPISVFVYRFVETGAPLVVFWDKSGKPVDENVTTNITLKVPQIFENPVWVDTITGDAYRIPAEKILVENGITTFTDIPAYDAPTFITGVKNLDLDKNERVKFLDAQESENL